MRLFQRVFHKLKHRENTAKDPGIYRIIAPSMLAICLCAVCLCGTSWAWFTANTSAGTTAIITPEYKLTYQVNDSTDTTELAEAKTVIVPDGGSCKITLYATGTAGATGYCSVQIGNSETLYYTDQINISADGTAMFTFTVNAAAGTEIKLTPKWGSCAVRNGSNTLANE